MFFCRGRAGFPTWLLVQAQRCFGLDVRILLCLRRSNVSLRMCLRLMFRALPLLRRKLAQSPPRMFIAGSWWLLIARNVMSLLHASRKWPEKVLCGCSWWKADKSVSHHTQHDISILHQFSFVRCRFAAIVFFGTDKVRARKAFVILCLFLRANVIMLHVQARVWHPC